MGEWKGKREKGKMRNRDQLEKTRNRHGKNIDKKNEFPEY